MLHEGWMLSRGRSCNSNLTDVTQEVMLHMQQILPKGKRSHSYRDNVEMPHDLPEGKYKKSVITQEMVL